MEICLKRFSETLPILALLCVSILVHGAPLTDSEKVEFIQGANNTCVAQNLANRVLSETEKQGIRNYCACYSSVLAQLVTAQEMSEFVAGRLPASLPQKVTESRNRCIEQLSN